MITARELAILFHDTYESLAQSFGYVTRPETREFDETSQNGKLMIAVCEAILEKFSGLSYPRLSDAEWQRFYEILRAGFLSDDVVRAGIRQLGQPRFLRLREQKEEKDVPA